MLFGKQNALHHPGASGLRGSFSTTVGLSPMQTSSQAWLIQNAEIDGRRGDLRVRGGLIHSIGVDLEPAPDEQNAASTIADAMYFANRSAIRGWCVDVLLHDRDIAGAIAQMAIEVLCRVVIGTHHQLHAPDTLITQPVFPDFHQTATKS